MIVLLPPSRAGHEFSMDASLGKDDRWHWGASLSPRTEVQGYKIVDVISVFIQIIWLKRMEHRSILDLLNHS
jgi:hypothetical protein